MRTRLFLLFAFAAVTVLTNAASAGNIAHGVEVVVIDPGHGGNDPGAHYGGTSEKDLTLKVALKLGKMIEEGMPGVKVVYTRKTDKALGLDKAKDLQARADIANKAGGDLFISIHVNAAKSTAARGVETLIMGESPKEQRYNENALFENNREDLIDMSDERTAAIVRAYIQNLQFTYGEYSMAIARCIQNNYLKAGRHSREHQTPAAARALCDRHAGRADRDRIPLQLAGGGLHEVGEGPDRDRPFDLRGREELFGLCARNAQCRRGGRCGA